MCGRFSVSYSFSKRLSPLTLKPIHLSDGAGALGRIAAPEAAAKVPADMPSERVTVPGAAGLAFALLAPFNVETMPEGASDAAGAAAEGTAVGGFGSPNVAPLWLLI